MAGNGSVFVTVGTTLFDAFIEAVDDRRVQDIIFGRGYTSLIIQIGSGKHIPKQVAGDSSAPGVLAVEHFTFTPSLADYVKSASLVISHAGSGSIYETLRAGKPLVVVVNELLMDNHQRELADVLASQHYLVCATPQSLGEVLANTDFSALKPYPPSEEGKFAEALDSFLGF